MKMLDLFSGIGGMSLAAEAVGIKTIAFCEIDEYCYQVLKKHWPDIPIYNDIRELSGYDFKGVDIIAGGFPCQPFSVAGKQRGKADDRHLWPEMFRIIRECRPTWVIGENVAGFVNMALEDTAIDLEGEGYQVRAFVLPACGVQAPHQRQRTFIVGYSEHNGLSTTAFERSVDKTGDNHQKGQEKSSESEGAGRPRNNKDVENTTSQRLERATGQSVQGDKSRFTCNDRDKFISNTKSESDRRYEREQGERQIQQFGISVIQSRGKGKTESRLGGVFDGISDWLDGYRFPAFFGEEQYEWEPNRVTMISKNRKQRLQALGNAVVPQQIYPIFKAIVEIENEGGVEL